MIPRVIHHVWPGEDPFRYPEWRASWMRHHPDADFRFWRHASSAMSSSVHRVLEDSHLSVVVKSDVLRWAVLLAEGGVYADTDMECLKPLGELLSDPRGCFLAKEDDEYVCTALIAAEPNHPFVQRILEATIAALAKVSPQEANERPNVITGPHLITRIAREHTGEVTLHPYPHFYPIHYGRRAAGTLKDAVTNHHWKAGWKDAPPPVPDASGRFRIAIAHAAHRPERVASLQPILEQLRTEGVEPVVFSSWKPETNVVWAKRIWLWAVRQSCPVLVLNDDVELAPGFTAAVAAMLRAAPGKILSLHAQGDDALAFAKRGERWIQLRWPTGPAYVIPNATTALAWLAFWNSEEVECRTQHEDGVIALWMRRTNSVTHACLPALVQHRVDVLSTYPGHDGANHRQSSVPWTAFADIDLTAWPSP